MAASYIDRERQLRSVFVGNIPFEATEAELREKFEQAGPIVSFRLVHDRESGKPKGYGFIEYQDVATANSCVRNLNNVEYNGRPLRVGPAAGDQNSDIKALQQALGGLQQESPYGTPIEPTEAPEAISKAVSSLPPEQMFDLMKQMKLCIQNNPNEARNMLLQNPQLAYALLQAQIVMKIVDPQVAIALLHRERDVVKPLQTEVDIPKSTASGPGVMSPGFKPSGGLLGEHPGAPPSGVSGGNNRMDPRMGHMERGGPSGGHQQDHWSGGRGSDPRGSGLSPRGGRGDMSGMDRGRDIGRRDGDSRSQDLDFRNRGNQDYGNWSNDPRDRRGGPPQQGGLLDAPRGNMRPGPGRGGPPNQPFGGVSGPSRQQGGPMGGPGGRGMSSDEDKEKAALIMQVLQLTDEQIAQLPPDQRQSILLLKQQIGGGGGR